MPQANYTIKATEAIQGAFKLAADRGNPETLPSHLLLALLQQDGGLAPRLLDRLGTPTADLEREVRDDLERLPTAQGAAEPSPSRDLRQVLDRATALAPQFQDQYISVEHLLMALVTVPSSSLFEKRRNSSPC